MYPNPKRNDLKEQHKEKEKSSKYMGSRLFSIEYDFISDRL